MISPGGKKRPTAMPAIDNAATPADVVAFLCRDMPSMADFIEVTHLSGDGKTVPLRFDVRIDVVRYKVALDAWAKAKLRQ
jgi:hypothetical protein